MNQPFDIDSGKISQLPFTLSYPIEQAATAIEKQQYGKAMNHLIDFFEISAPFCSFVFLRLLQQASTNNAAILPALRQFVDKIDNKRPLSFGDWLNDLLTPLIAAAAKHMPQSSLTKSFCDNIYIKRRNILLGSKTSASIVQLRNEYRGHSTTLSEEIYRQVVEQLIPRTQSMLNAIMPLANCSYVINRDCYKISSDATNEQPAFTIDLYPLVFCDENDFRYVFQSLKDERASFTSSNENAVTLITDSLNSAIDSDLQRIAPWFDIAKDLNWEEAKMHMKKQSQQFLRRVYAEKKYNRELFVERAALTNSLHAFWQSHATLFPLIGEAGQGKTNQLAYWTEQLIAADKPVLILNSSDFTSITLGNFLKGVFSFNPRRDIHRLCENINRLAKQNNQHVYVFFDAINECLKYADDESGAEGPLALYCDICAVMAREEFSQFKVLFTCRGFTWKNVILPHTQAQSHILFNDHSEGTKVRGFNNDELAQAYDIYQQLYQMHTPFAHIDRRVALRLTDPLTLKFASTIFLGKALSEQPADYTSITLFRTMCSDIANSYAGKQQSAILRLIGKHMLMCYLANETTDGIDVNELREALTQPHAKLHELAQLIYKSDGISIAYAELLNKADRPILKEVTRNTTKGERIYIQFIYERFLEYILAQAFIELHQSPQPSHFIDALKATDASVVWIGALRNALIDTCIANRSFDVFIQLQNNWGDDYNVMSLLNDTIGALISENYEDQLFTLLKLLIAGSNTDNATIEQFNQVVKIIENNQADDSTIALHKSLETQLSSTIRLKRLASVSLINGVLLTDYFNEGLYKHNAMTLLWQIMTDPIYDIRNDSCMYAYYLSKRHHTSSHTPLKQNLTERIIVEMYASIKQHSLLRVLAAPRLRKNALIFLETATRLAVLLIIDNMLDCNDDRRTQATKMLDEIKQIFRYFTANLYLIKIFLPFLQIAMKKQITFQSDYVNNAMEYQSHWHENTFNNIAYNGAEWNRHDVDTAMSFCHHHVKAVQGMSPEQIGDEEERWRQFQPKVLSAYRSGDSFSYFVLERIQVIMGVCNWNNYKPIATAFFSDDFRSSKWFDYSQMSMLYVLYQIALQSHKPNAELLDIYTREAADWTLRCRGLFVGHHSKKANSRGRYKRNVMSWYAAVFFATSPDCNQTDSDAMPAFYSLIDLATKNKDRELLTHLVENIQEMITDIGLPRAALQLLKHIMSKFNTIEQVNEYDNTTSQRDGTYQFGIVKLIGNVLSTAKNYCPELVNQFLQQDVACLPFPGINSYRDSLLNYNPSGESLQDVLTHKFGNFLIFSLVNVEAIDNFSVEAIAAASRSKDAFAWFEQVVKILIRHLFIK